MCNEVVVRQWDGGKNAVFVRGFGLPDRVTAQPYSHRLVVVSNNLLVTQRQNAAQSLG